MAQQTLIHNLTFIAVLAPLIGATIAGIWGKVIGRKGAHWITIIGVGIACLCSLTLFKLLIFDGASTYNGAVYTWALSGSFRFDVGFLVDHLTVGMMVVVTFVSLMVHIYTIRYMADDTGYQRFFSYMSLFTFMMLILVVANNFMLLFFGWEGVGLVSYLLIGFWFKRESAIQGSLKAFLVNRVGDFGFLLGVAAVLTYFGTVDYASVFSHVSKVTGTTMMIWPGHSWSVISVICILLFVGAMGKSAQIPLHVWLPESMEGPTPISALIHAATMVTAGVYMVARMSPLFELSVPAQSLVLIVGATGALFMGILAVVQFDIKRVIAYSTMSQLGYMMAACGVSAYAAGIFHLYTHAFFKALLFLAAGSVIIAMHHEKDMRKMGGLRKYMPITYITFLIGGLSMCAIPPLSGYYSKDAIIDAVQLASIPGATYAYYCVLLGAFVTALYTFRAFFMTFHTKERMGEDLRKQLRECPPVVTVPLILLAIPSAVLGLWLAGPMLYNAKGLLGRAIYVAPSFNVLTDMAKGYHGVWPLAAEAFTNTTLWVTLAGILVAWVCYIKVPSIPGRLTERFKMLYKIFVYKYGFDEFNQLVFVRGSRRLADFLYYITDMKFIDNLFVDGSGRSVRGMSRVFRRAQTGYLYHYAFAMILGVVALLCWMLFAR